MALGQAAGVAACVAVEDNVAVGKVDIAKVQRRLLRQGAVLIYFQDAKPGDEHYEALQFFALRGFYRPDQWQAKLNDAVPADVALKWIEAVGTPGPAGYAPGKTTRGELLDMLYKKVRTKR